MEPDIIKKNRGIPKMVRNKRFLQIDYINPTNPFKHSFNLRSQKIENDELMSIIKEIQQYEKGTQNYTDLFIQLEGNKIEQEGCRYLAMTPKWTNLVRINLQNNRIGVKGCQRLSKTHWYSLKELNLSENKIQDDGCKHLSKAQWYQLQRLDFQKNQITDRGMLKLFKANWPQLTSTSFNGNKIGKVGYSVLASMSWIKPIN